MFVTSLAYNRIFSNRKTYRHINSFEFLVAITLIVVGVLGHKAALHIHAGGAYACLTIGTLEAAVSLFVLFLMIEKKLRYRPHRAPPHVPVPPQKKGIRIQDPSFIVASAAGISSNASSAIDPPVKWFDKDGVRVNLDLSKCRIKREAHFKGDYSIPAIALTLAENDEMQEFFRGAVAECRKRASLMDNVHDDGKDLGVSTVLDHAAALISRPDYRTIFSHLWKQLESEKQDNAFFKKCLRIFTQLGQITAGNHCMQRKVEVIHSIYTTYIVHDDVLWNVASIRTKIATDVIDDLTTSGSFAEREQSATRIAHLRTHAAKFKLIAPEDPGYVTILITPLNGDFETTFNERYTFDRIARLFLNRFDGKILDYVQKHFTVERGDGSKGAPTKHDFLFGDYSWDMTGVALYFLAHDLITVDGQNPSDMKDQKS